MNFLQYFGVKKAFLWRVFRQLFQVMKATVLPDSRRNPRDNKGIAARIQAATP